MPAQKDRGPFVHQNEYDILRDAIVDTRQREEAARRATDDGDMYISQPRSGEKRESDDNADGSCDKESYLEVAGKYRWETENKRRKRGNSGDHVLPIYGVKTTPQRDIFVRDLAYSMCSSPEESRSTSKKTL